MSGSASRINGQKGGRPKGSENFDTKQRREMRNRWLERVHDKADPIFDVHLDLALGYYTETQASEGVVRVYKRPPDARSLHWIMEQVWGKASSLIQPQATPDQEEDGQISEELQRSISRAIQYAMPASRRTERLGLNKPIRSLSIPKTIL